ncbi:phosphotransferase [uncultured Shimia sp.]|uniref:aminoglycoside phosphotransferase family protein n=1 Tax=uncultured Shimia sp. TaxID=573152 RepID=UPI0026070A87|nr:phosphotransferase [uncultured Shimia sp.]
MDDRARLIDQFLSQAGWSEALAKPLAGDASNRRYVRLSQGKKRAVLMDAPPTSGEDVRPFVTIATWLRNAGLSAPEILFEDPDNGLLLLEDLGDDIFVRVVADAPDQELPLYRAATDVLLSLHRLPAPDTLVAYTPQRMAEMTAPVYDWYLRGCGGDPSKSSGLVAPFQDILEANCPETDVIILRDYHAENLLWLPDRQGVARVGLLDFQDALVGHRSYDLASLLQDIRRDVPLEIEEAMILHYVEHSGLEEQRFRVAYAAQAVQRNLRILGIFARLCLHSGKPHYVDYMPRLWSLILRGLNHPALAEVRTIVLKDLPEPNAALMKKLKDQCAKIPTP